MTILSPSTIDRFWAKVVKTDSCWPWTASKANKGYGAFGFRRDGRSVTVKAHRFSWELHNGPIPDGLCVLHRRDVPACVNPDHLFLGTKRDNNADMVAKGRHVPGGTYSTARYRRGELSPHAKITEGIVVRIRDRHARGESYAALARDFGLSWQTVGHIVRRERWKHVL